MSLVFKIADDNGLLLLDLKDLQAMLQHVGDSAKDFQTQYGNISPGAFRHLLTRRLSRRACVNTKTLRTETFS